MITLRTEVTLGSVEITGNSAAEVQANLQQLLGSSDLLLAWGRVKAQLDSSNTEIEAKSNIGSMLGGEAIGPEELWSTTNHPVFRTPFDDIATVNVYTDPSTGRKALWWGQQGEATDDHTDTGLQDGSKRYWLWLNE